MTVKDFYNLLDSVYKIDSQDEWDNSGMYEFGSDNPIVNPILSLDINLDVVNYAIEKNSNLILSHHPIFIDPLDEKKKHIKSIFQKLSEHNISVISLHTCFDKNPKGTTYQIIKRLKGFNISRSKKSPYLFFGVSNSKLTFADLVKKIKNNLEIEYVNVLLSKLTNDEKKPKYIKIAAVGGSGSSEIETIIKKDKIDFFITSEVKWHLWNKNNQDYFTILEIPHSVEKVFIKTIKEKFKNIDFLEFYPNKIEML